MPAPPTVNWASKWILREDESIKWFRFLTGKAKLDDSLCRAPGFVSGLPRLRESAPARPVSPMDGWIEAARTEIADARPRPLLECVLPSGYLLPLRGSICNLPRGCCGSIRRRDYRASSGRRG